MIKHLWMEKAETTWNYHREKLRANDKHRLKDTAKETGQSIGRVSEYLQLAEAMKETEMRKKLERFKFAEDALSFLKDHRKEQRMI